ncbi:uncharacterized protein LOC142225845 [Haematobia irritans]|uniref:uncharacterized protein LOC142225845 n=1 Tax=Haematobia irritans TaxID=7368 RepID=UPI003F504F77
MNNSKKEFELGIEKMDSSDSSVPEKVKSKFPKQRFPSSWLADDVFKGWLEPVEGDEYKSKCEAYKACRNLLNCGSSKLKKTRCNQSASEERSRNKEVDQYSKFF